MAKAYWVSCYHSISDPAARAAYAKLAGPALRAAGGRYIALGRPAKVYEAGIDLPVVLVEFDSVAQAIAADESPGYQAVGCSRQYGGSARHAHRRRHDD